MNTCDGKYLYIRAISILMKKISNAEAKMMATKQKRKLNEMVKIREKSLRNCVLREQRHLPLVLALTYRLRDALAAANGKSKFYCWIFFCVDFISWTASEY